MKLNEAFTILTEGRSQKIDTETVANFIEQHCKDYIKSIGSGSVVPIYRGVRGYNYPLLVKPSNSERRSANTTNFYTYFIDHSREWSQFPKRSRSAVCTTSMNKASKFGDVYLVIPTDGADIGVCEKDDLWFSFSFCFKQLDIQTLNEFNNLFEICGEIINDYMGKRIAISDDESSIQRIEQNFDKILDRGVKVTDSLFRAKIINAIGIPDERIDRMLETFFKQGGIQAGVDYLLDPEKNNIHLTSYPLRKGLVNNGRNGSEVWTDVDCIMYPAGKIQDLYDALGV